MTLTLNLMYDNELFLQMEDVMADTLLLAYEN
jgi:hypothetical protein